MLHNLLQPARLTAVVDVGANPIDGEPPYKAMLQRRLCTVVGFEPQDEALAELNARKSDLESYYHYVVGNGHKAKLRLCRLPGMTSLLVPDQNVLSHFAKFTEWGSVVSEHPVQTRRLDDILEIRDLDFLKIDVQGSELAVFGSGRQKLKQAVAVETEVSFLCLYKEQPTFGDIDGELRKQGFVPHAFTAVKQRMIAPLSDPSNPHAAMNQLLEADIVYVRNFMRSADMTVEQLMHLAMIAHHCYRSFDLAANCVHHLIARKAIPDRSIHDYMASVQVSGR
ncbi:FkbM family methyltransferase [Bradyrhizobium manausense]|uniref:FkbM family methyltransferase n=1 Tax=Bradyrhizobium TaxID=374 RepID=UPI001BA6CAF6|nr:MULTISPECIES: FkbM family methyltransferase [Bradyrhizobium]MBR0828864.1 FkbM family methyltransferase [Bradyrhizobium manausense]UVO28127.1 FkbM family methyltransferase [Bradyrhizobium arachidis]